MFRIVAPDDGFTMETCFPQKENNNRKQTAPSLEEYNMFYTIGSLQ